MKTKLRDYRGVFYPVGMVVMGLAWAALLSAVAGYLFNWLDPTDNPAHRNGEGALLISAGITMGAGLLMTMFGKRHSTGDLNRREAVLAVALIWFAAGVFSAIPFVIGADMTPADALFEAISGLTTTGATVITDIETRLSRELLLWRSLIQWLGGMGIVVLFVSVFPNIGTGGKYMSAREVPGTSSEGLRPRIAETSRVLWQFYAAFTVIEMLILWALGMSFFEALCHAFTTMSTGGFSTRDASVAGFNSVGIELTIAFFMLLGSVNYALFYAALRTRSIKAILRSTEFQVFAGMVVFCTVVLTLGILPLHHGDLFEAFRYAIFMVATSFSSTGYGTDDYMAYSSPMLFLVILMMFVGGCAGSTAGGIKVERIVMLSKLGWGQLQRSFRPNLVHLVRMGRSVVSQAALTDVAVFFSIFMLSMAVSTGLITAIEGVSVPTAFGATLTSLSNMGPAPFHPGADNFAAYSAATKIVCTIVMLLGRLEFYALLALIVPSFWRR